MSKPALPRRAPAARFGQTSGRDSPGERRPPRLRHYSHSPGRGSAQRAACPVPASPRPVVSLPPSGNGPRRVWRWRFSGRRRRLGDGLCGGRRRRFRACHSPRTCGLMDHNRAERMRGGFHQHTQYSGTMLRMPWGRGADNCSTDEGAATGTGVTADGAVELPSGPQSAAQARHAAAHAPPAQISGAMVRRFG